MRQDYDRVSYQPIQIMEPPNNPAPNVVGLSRSQSHPVMLDLPQKTIAMSAPVIGSSGNPIVLDPADISHVYVAESPASPDPSPPTSPVNTHKKRQAPSPPVSPSKVRYEGLRYLPMQDHQFQCPECPLTSSPTLNGHFNLGMTGEVWPLRRLARSSQSTPHQRRRAPSPPT